MLGDDHPRSRQSVGRDRSQTGPGLLAAILAGNKMATTSVLFLPKQEVIIEQSQGFSPFLQAWKNGIQNGMDLSHFRLFGQQFDVPLAGIAFCGVSK